MDKWINEGINGVGPREVADVLEDFCRKGPYYGLKVHFSGPKTYLRDKESVLARASKRR